jgi:hypothetical protein
MDCGMLLIDLTALLGLMTGAIGIWVRDNRDDVLRKKPHPFS